jgi:hypothetical protein
MREPNAQPFHITYATREYSRSARSLLAQSAALGFPTRCYAPNDAVVRQLTKQYPATMRDTKGAGYWLWKPAIILDALTSLPEGAMLLYTDAGVRLVGDPRQLFREGSSLPIILFEQPQNGEDPDFHLQRRWTKRDRFVTLEADAPEFWQSRQLSASFIGCRNGEVARQFVRNWLDGCRQIDALDDRPNTKGKPDFPDFVAHRHDQSILTIMAVRADVRPLRSPAVASADRGGIFDHFRRRPGRLTQLLAPLGRVLRPRSRIKRLLALTRGTA